MSDNLAQSNVSSNTARASNYSIIYSDTFSIRPTGVDFTLTFGVQNDVPGQQGPVLIEQVTVSMTLSLAKSLAINLRRVIQAIEQAIGPVPTVASGIVPDDFLEQIKQHLEGNPIVIKGIADFDDPPD